ncbi:hypothetical protein BDW72DRAFT_139653 [Aspergillus terricola var. indicus]
MQWMRLTSILGILSKEGPKWIEALIGSAVTFSIEGNFFRDSGDVLAAMKTVLMASRKISPSGPDIFQPSGISIGTAIRYRSGRRCASASKYVNARHHTIRSAQPGE